MYGLDIPLPERTLTGISWAVQIGFSAFSLQMALCNCKINFASKVGNLIKQPSHNKQKHFCDNLTCIIDMISEYAKVHVSTLIAPSIPTPTTFSIHRGSSFTETSKHLMSPCVWPATKSPQLRSWSCFSLSWKLLESSLADKSSLQITNCRKGFSKVHSAGKWFKAPVLMSAL